MRTRMALGAVAVLPWLGSAVPAQPATPASADVRMKMFEPDHDHFHASELGHEGTGRHPEHPHFTHPLVTESPLPEDQVRFNAGFASVAAGSEVLADVSTEFTLTPNLAMELAVPYVWINPEDGGGADGIGNAEVAIKYGDYRFGRSGVLLGVGMAVELPTGDDDAGTGDDRQIGLEPYVGFGYRRDEFEMIGLLRFGVPVNERAADEDEVDLELSADLSLLYHFTPRAAGLLEFNGAAVVAGEADDTVLTINPGVSIDPTGGGRFRIAVGVGAPLTDDAGFDYEVRTMVIFHF